MNINSFPDDCLRLVLRRSPLIELVHLRCICSRWKGLIEEMFFEHKHSLKIFGSKYDMRHFGEVVGNHRINEHIDLKLRSDGNIDDILILKDTGGYAACLAIPFLFPNISKLLICAKQIFQQSDCFPQFLLSYAPRLKSLSLCARMIPIPENVIRTINSLNGLQRLYMIEFFRSKIPDGLTVLKQVNHFTVAHYVADIVDLLAQLGPGCSELCFCWVNLTAEKMVHLLQINPHLERNVTHLVYGFVATSHNNRLKHSYNLFQLICDRFTNLQSIDITFTDRLPLVLLIPELFKLKHLTELYLYLSSAELPSDTDRLYSLSQLTTVTDLKLEVYNLSKEQFRYWIGNLFPNVEKLVLRIDIEDSERMSFQEECLTADVFPKLSRWQFSY